MVERKFILLIALLIVIIPLLSCSRETDNKKLKVTATDIEPTTSENEKPFYRETMVYRYIKEQTTINDDAEYLLALINTTDCGASTINDISNIKKDNYSDKALGVYYLFTEEETELLKRVIDTNDLIIPTDIEILEKYGLRLFTPYLFHIKKGEILSWEKIKK